MLCLTEPKVSRKLWMVDICILSCQTRPEVLQDSTANLSIMLRRILQAACLGCICLWNDDCIVDPDLISWTTCDESV